MENLCTPALVYLVISIIGIIYAFFTMSIGSTLVKALFVFIWTWFLNFLCNKGYKGISWFLVVFPYVLMLLMFFIAFEVFAITNAVKHSEHEGFDY